MPWAAVKTREEARKLQRENAIAEKLLAEEWISAEALHGITSNYFSKIEQVPSKFRAETGISDANMKKLLAMLDQARQDAAADVRREFLEAKKRVQKEAK